MHAGRYWHQSFWNWRLFSSSFEVSWYLEYQLHIKGTVLYFWCSLRCIKIWILIYYNELRFPQRAVVLFLLQSDATCISLNGHCAGKSAMLILEWCYKAIGDGEQVFEGTDCMKSAIRNDMTRLQVMVALERLVGWGSNKALTLLYLVTWSGTLTYGVKTQDLRHYDSHQWPKSLLMHQIDLCFVYCFLFMWTFCQAVLLLTYVFATRIWSCC